MPQTSKNKLRYPAPNDSSNVWQYWQNLAEDSDGQLIESVTNQAGRDALTPWAGAMVFRQDTGDYESYYNGSWSRVAGPLIQGKMWRTSGTSTAVTPNTDTKVIMDAGRTVGGMTFSNSGDTLTLPRSGYYDLRARGYVTGGGTYWHSWRIVRQRTGVSDLEIVLSNLGRKTDTEDEVAYASDVLPLQSGDALYLRTRMSAAGIYYGIGEFNGLFLSATFMAPLYGAAVV